MLIEQIIVLAVVQGLTEFLPISSSGHLILIPALTGWSDQGVVTDVMVHLGSLFAIIVYFWRDVVMLFRGAGDLLRGQITQSAKLLIYLALSTIPIIAVGLLLVSTGLQSYLRGVHVVAYTAIGFGLLLYIADRWGERVKRVEDMTLTNAVLIGCAQAIALIPGTSRSGITITAGRLLGFKRTEAARFSFLLGIPAISSATIFTGLEVWLNGDEISSDAWLAAGLAFFSAIFAIWLLMALIKRVSFLPFMIYRLVLGLTLLLAIEGWLPGLTL